MGEFARLGEKAIERRNELTRGELELYCFILLHSFLNHDGLRICSKKIPEICRLWGLEYHNTVRRFARMKRGESSPKTMPKNVQPMKSPWLTEKWIEGKKVIVCLVGVEKTIAVDFEIKTKDKTAEEVIVSRTPTAPNKKNQREYSDGHKSIFTKEQCIEYARSLSHVRNPGAYGKNLYLSGEADIDIQRFFDSKTKLEKSVTDEDRLQNALKLLLEVQADGFDVQEYKQWYPDEKEWQWLMNNLEKAKAVTN